MKLKVGSSGLFIMNLWVTNRICEKRDFQDNKKINYGNYTIEIKTRIPHLKHLFMVNFLL